MIAIAWRNLMRNRVRTGLTASGIAFAVFLVSFAMSLQAGSYGLMIDAASRFFMGHGEVVTDAFVDKERFEHTVVGVSALRGRLGDSGALTVTPRVQAFGIVSMGERSYAGMILGMDFATEKAAMDLLNSISSGEVPSRSDQGVIGAALARNLGVGLNDEVVVLGSGKDGTVAAMALTVSAILTTGQAELDRSLLLVPIATMQDAFYLVDEAHRLILIVNQDTDLNASLQAVAARLSGNLVLRTWRDLMPEIEKSIELDKISATIFYAILLVLVTFAVVNTFVMLVYDRTKEFGMLLALGMRPWQIIGQIQLEALLLSLLGVAGGLIAGGLFVSYLADVGIPLPLDDFGGEQITAQMYLGSMDRIYPTLSLLSVSMAPLTMMLGTQAASLLSMMRIRRIRPVNALRSE